MAEVLLDRKENILGKGEDAGNKHLFCFNTYTAE